MKFGELFISIFSNIIPSYSICSTQKLNKSDPREFPTPDKGQFVSNICYVHTKATKIIVSRVREKIQMAKVKSPRTSYNAVKFDFVVIDMLMALERRYR